jgi:hypothetical protein
MGSGPAEVTAAQRPGRAQNLLLSARGGWGQVACSLAKGEFWTLARPFDRELWRMNERLARDAAVPAPALENDLLRPRTAPLCPQPAQTSGPRRL